MCLCFVHCPVEWGMVDWESLTKIVQSIFTSSGILVGGIWAYFKFLRGRVYKPRMELNVVCLPYLQKDHLVLLHVKVELKNVGLSKIKIDRCCSAIRIHRILKLKNQDLLKEKALESNWKHIGSFPLFKEHEWIEPSEVIRDEKILEFTNDQFAFKIEAIVMSEAQQWYSSSISLAKISNFD